MDLLQFLFNLNHMVSLMVLASVGSDFKAYILEATGTWHVQHESFDCRCDIVSIRHKENFLTKECNKNQI